MAKIHVDVLSRITIDERRRFAASRRERGEAPREPVCVRLTLRQLDSAGGRRGDEMGEESEESKKNDGETPHHAEYSSSFKQRSGGVLAWTRKDCDFYKKNK